MFITEDFLLQSDLSKELYRTVKEMPIIDYGFMKNVYILKNVICKSTLVERIKILLSFI